MYRTDYHIHTFFSDGGADAGAYTEAARLAGLSEIGFSDHLTLTDKRQHWSMDRSGLPAYVERIERLRDSCPDITVRLGLEADYLPGREEELLACLNAHPFDYVIGSVHFMGEKTVDLGREFYEGRDIAAIYEQYFDLVSEAAATGLFDIIGHPDLVRIYGCHHPGDPLPLYRELALSLRKQDVAFEINTNGRNKPLGDFYPDRRFLHVFADAGLPLCINSDAHTPSRVGQHFDEAYRLAADAGFTDIAVFSGRKRSMLPLEMREGRHSG